MATYNKFQDFVEQLGLGVHNLNTHTFKVFLTNEQPLVTDTVKTDIADITAQNGYPAGGTDIQNVWSETAGVGTVAVTDVVFTAAGGSFGPFKFAVIYNDTAANDNLCCWWEYPGGSISCQDTETLTVDFAGNVLFTME